MAASMFASFWSYLVVCFVEVIGWIAYAAGYNLMLRVWSEFTYYSVIWLLPSWLFAFIEMTASPAQGGVAMD